MRFPARSAALAASLLWAAAARATDAPFAVGAPLAGRAVFGCSGVTLVEASVGSDGVATWSAKQGLGHVASNGDVVLSGRTSVQGDVTPGPGRRAVVPPEAKVTGLTTPARDAADCRPVDLAAFDAFRSKNDNAQIPKTAAGRDAVKDGALVLDGPDPLTLPAGTYVFGSVVLTNRAHVNLTGETHIFVTGSVSLSGNSHLNPAGGGFRLRLVVAGPTVDLDTLSTLGAFVYAPSAAVTLAGGSRLVGALFSDSVFVKEASVATRAVDDTAPVLDLSEPATDSAVTLSAVRVRGTVRDPETVVSSLTVNGVAVPVADGGAFEVMVDATDSKEVRADATNAAGLKSTVRRPLCSGKPTVAILSPANGSVVGARTGSVTGTSGSAASVTVNGVPAALAGGSFRLDGVDFGPDGVATVTVVASNACARETAVSAFVVDTIPPAVAIDSPRPGAVFGSSPITVSGAYVEANLVDITVNGVVATITGTRFTATGIAIPPGASTLVAVARDRVGRTGQSSPVSVSLDNSSPSVRITSPAPDTLTASTTITVTGVADVPGLAGVKVAGRPALISGTGFSVAGVPLVEGDNSLVAGATDGGGRTYLSSPVVVTLDSLPPEVTLDTAGLPPLTNLTSVAVSGTVSDPHLAGVTVNGVTALVSGGRFAASAVPLAEGDNALRAHATDTLSHAADSNSFTVNLDTQAPAVTITSPAPNALLAASTVTVTGTASDPHLAGVTVNGVAAAVANGAFTVQLTLAEGDTALVARAADTAGNVGASPGVTVTVDTLPPVLAIDAPADPVTTSAFVTVTGTVVEPHLLSLVVGGVPASVSGGRWVAASVPLVEGTQQITAVGFDTVGHRGESAPVTYRLDSTPSVLTLDAPAAGAPCRASGPPVAVSGRVFGRSGVRPTVKLDVQTAAGAVQTFTATLDSAGTTWTVPAVDLGSTDGTATLTASTSDAFGLVVRVLRTFRIKASIPSVRLLLDGTTFPGSAAGAAAAPGEQPALFGRALAARARVTDSPDAAPPSATLILDGASYVDGTAIAVEGTHLLVARVVDCAGHEGAAHALFAIDVTPPRLLSTTPSDGATLGSAVSSFSGTSDPDLASATVNGAAAAVAGGTFSIAPFSSKEGANTLAIVLVDRAGNRSTFSRSFSVKSLVPFVEILESGLPIPPGTTFFRAVVPVVRSNDSTATVAATLNGAGFTSGATVSTSGDYVLAATATDALGHRGSATATFKVDLTSGPAVDISSPADGAVLPGPTVAVSGTVSASVVNVTVNGRAATLTGTAWSLPDLVLPPDVSTEIVAIAADAAGRTASATRQVTVRASGPQILILDPVDGTKTNRKRIDVAGAVVGGPSATADGKVTAAGQTLTLDALGTFRAKDVVLQSGANTLTASATDPLGRTGTAAVTVTTDTTAPGISLTADGQPLADGASFARPFTLRVAITDDATPLPVPTIRLNGQDKGATAAVTDLPITQAGGYILSVVARDAAGNESRADRSFVLASGGCAVSALDPGDGAVVAAPKVTLKGRSGDAASVTVTSGGLTFTSQLADGTFAAGDVPLPVVGANVLTVACTDRAGATASVTLNISRLADGAGPLVRITQPASGSRQSAGTAAASGTVSDPAATVTVNGVKATALGGNFTAPPIPLAEGPNVLAARAVDAAGRVGEDRVVVFRDSAAPKIAITSPPDGAHVGKPGSGAAAVNVSGFVDLTSEPNLASVVVSTGAGSVTATVDADTGAFYASGVPLATAAPGSPQSVTATATDALGQSASATISVVYDPAGPALALSAPIDGTRYNETTAPPSFPVSGEAWAKDGAIVAINGGGLDGVTWDAAGADGRRHASFTAQVSLPAAEGPFGVIARVEEPAGAWANDKRLLFMDVTAPTVVDIQPADGAKQVDANEILLVLFSETIRPSSLGANDGLTLTRLSTGDKVVGTFTIAGSAVAFTPGAAMVRGEAYRFRAGTGITDLATHALAAAVESRFTVAALGTSAPPTLDPLPPVVCATQIVVSGSAAPNASVRLRDGVLSVTGNADASGRFAITLPLSGNGWHAVHAAVLDSGGTAGPEAAALFRVDCSAPTAVGATFDRGTGKITLVFSEAMQLSTLTVGGAGSAITVSKADDATNAPQAAALSLSGDGATATLDLGSGPSAWWTNLSVRLSVGPPAADAASNVMSAPFTTVFFAGGGGDLSGGFLSGAALDDESGRPLAGADAKLYASGAALPGSVPAALVTPPTASTVTDGRGRYSLAGSLAAGRYALVLSRAGYTRTVRRLALEPSVGAVPFGSRLTPLAAQTPSLLVPGSGGSFAGPAGSNASVDFAPNALLSSVNLGVRLTPLSGQGLPEPLPLGWTPLAAAELRLVPNGAGDDALPEGAGTPFTAGGVTLTLPLPAGINTADLYAARYDVVAGAWLALPLPVFVAGSGSVPDRARVALTGPGSVAILAPDADPATRPPVLPVSLDAPLVGADAPPATPALTATIALDPAIVSPTGRATARVLAKAADGATPWPSGLAVQAYLDEKLILAGGSGELYEAPFTADLVLYHVPLSSGDLGGTAPGAAGALTFRISPSPRAAQVLLDTGYENVRLFPFTDQLERGQVLGPAGGSVTTADGIELIVPESGLAQKTVVTARALTAAERAALPPVAGYTTVAAVRVGLSGAALARPATLRLTAPGGLPADAADDPRLLLATFVDQPDDGRGAFANAVSRVTLLPGAGAVPAKLVASPEAPGSPLPFPGLAGEGLFLFLHANAPIGFVTGRVTAPNGAGIPGSRVIAAGLGTANLSVPGGVYAVPAPAGSPTLNALHPVLGVAGSGQVPSLAKGQVATLDLVLTPVPPTIRALQPPDGATDQPVGSTAAVAFSAALDPASVTAATLTVELANADGTGTGLFFTGSVSLSPDKTTVVFGPARPLPPGRTIRATFKAGVRGADGTPYAGTLPVAWSFKTSTQFVAGGAIHPEKIRLLIPVNGVAQIVGADGALPAVVGGTTPWSVWADLDGPICPSKVTQPANTNGGFTLNAGCPPTASVTIASKVYIHILDPTGTEAATFKLGPFLTPDGTGFVAPPGETTVVTTPEGIEVTSPAAAFDVPTLVTVKKLDPSTLGVPIQQGMEIGAYVNVDFDGTANETLRLRIPTTSSAPVGSLVFAGTALDLPWGRKIKMLDLGRVVAGPSGQKLISNLEEDQPAAPALIATAPGGRAALAQRRPQALRQCKFTDKKTGDIFTGPCPLLRNIFAEFTARASAVFINGATAELAAITGQAQIFEIGKEFEVLYNFYADSFVYLPPAQDWDGSYILPVVVGAPLKVVIRDRAAGWIRAEQDFAAITGGAGSILKVPEFPPGTSRPPSILDGAPFSFSRFHAPLTESGLSCLALRLEVQGCSSGLGTALLRATGGSFLLAEGGQVELFNMDAGNRSGAATVDRFGLFPDLTVPAQGNEELMAVLTPGDLDPGGLSELSFVFDQALAPITDLTKVAKLFDCGLTTETVCANAPVPVESIQSVAGDRLSIVPAGTLPYGHRFRLDLNPTVLVVRGATGPIGYPGWAPAAFVFATRNPANGPIGSLPNPTDPIPSLGNTDSARDLLKFGNLLMVASAGAKILAIDVSDPARPKRFALLNNSDQDVRSFATDGHNRLFYNFVGASTWGVGAIRIEDVRHASPSACPAGLPAWASGISCFDRVLGGVRTAFALGFGSDLTGSDFLSLAGSLPTGTPTSMQILVEDASEDDKELKDFYDSHWGTGGFDLLVPDADGFYTFKVALDTKGHLAQRGQTCPGENPWDHFQRVTIDNVTTAQSWSFDVENPWPVQPPGSTTGDGTLTADGIRARRGDRLRVRYNLRALGYLAIIGSGISVVDLNRFYRTPLTAGVGTGGQNNLGECGRRLGKLEGQDVMFPPCFAPGNPAREIPPPDKGIALTSDLVVLPAPGESGAIGGGAAGGIGVFSALRNFGAVQSGSPDDNPGKLEIGATQCLRGLGNVWLRSVALAEGVSYQYENNQINLVSGSVVHLPGRPYMREGRTLVFFSLGDPGILVVDVTDGWMDPIGLLTRPGHSVYRLQADARGGRLFAGATRSDGLPVIDVWSLAAVNEAPQAFGSDPRFLLSVAAPWDTNHIALDETGTGLLYTWGQGVAGRQGGLAIPIESPRFVYAGVFLEGQNGIVSGTPKPVVRVADRLYPLGVPTRVDPKDEVDPTKRNESQQKATAAFKVRLALPGGLGIPESDLDEITAKVQTLRALPDNRLLAQENLGRAVAVPGGSAWPARDVFVRLKRIGKVAKFDGPQDTGENGRFAPVYNLYESKEVVLLVADPRARKDYRGGAAATPASDVSSERLQCRRCDRPAYLGAFADADIKELLAGGPYVRAFLAVDPDSPGTTRDKTQKVLDFFGDPAIKDNYRAPIGTEPVAAWADSVPSAVQVSLAEPAQNAAAFSPGEAGVNVSMVSGDVLLRASDHTVAGRGLAFLFDRTYRSGVAGYGPLGAAGWSANLFAHLRVLPPIEDLGFPGEIEYYDGSGNVFRFYPPKLDLPPKDQCPLDTELDKSASYCAPKGLYVRLIQLEAGKGWRLLDRQHGMMSFDANGRLFDDSDRFRKGEDDTEKQGSTLKFGYDGFGFLVHVEDDLGRPYQFTYKDDPVADGNEYGLLVRMADFHGREVTYQYDAAHERLLSGVTFPGVTNPFYPGFGTPTPQVSYSYADPGLSPVAPLHERFGKLRLQGFTLPGGTQPRAAFGFEPATGRVREVRFPSGGPSGVVWKLGGYAGAADQAATAVTVTAPWGHEAVYSFDKGRIATKSEVLPYVGLDDKEVVGSIVTKYSYRDDGRASAIDWADGSQTNYCYADSGCPVTGSTDRLALPNVLNVSRARGAAPKGPAQHADTVNVTVGYDGDSQIANATDPLGRPVVKAVPSANGTSVSGYPGENVSGTSTFDERGRLKSFTGDPAGPSGKPINVTLIYEESKSSPNYGRLVQMRRGGVGESYVYDEVGNLRTKTTTYNVTTAMDHDEWDREIQTIEGVVNPDLASPGAPPYTPVAGVVTQRAYDAAGHILRERRNQDPHGFVETRYAYNQREQLVDVFQTHLATDKPDGSVVSAPVLVAHNDYDAVTGLIVASVSAEGTVTHYGYDSAGRLTTTQTGLVPAQVTKPQSTGGVKRQAYDVMGRVALETDGDAGIWRGRYDAWGRLFQETLPTRAVVEREFDLSGNVVKETVFDGPTGAGLTPARLSERTMKVNAFGSPAEIRELLKPGAGAEPDVIRLTKRTYDGNGRLVLEESGPDGGALRRDVKIDYEAGSGRLAFQTDGVGNQSEFLYGQASPWPTRIVQHETVPGSATLIDTDWVETARDALGRAIEQKTRSGSLTLFTYDQAGNLLTHAQGGAVTIATYDGRGNVLKFDRPGARGSTFYAYDLDGRHLSRLSSAALARVNLTSYEYDKPTGRLLKVTHADRKTFESYTYNPDETLDVWTTRSGVAVKHVYDDANRLLARIPSAPGAVNLPVVLDSSDSYTYDVASRLTNARRLTLGAGSAVAPSSVTYEDYDTGGRPGRETLGEAAARRDPLLRSYDIFDRSVGMSLPAGVGRAPAGSFLGYGHTYDDLDRTTSLCGDPTLVAQVACGAYPGTIGAKFAWGGAARLYGVTTRGPLKTAHRFGYISGPGAQPPSTAALGNDFRLGTLTVGSTQQDAVTFATKPMDAAWGGLGYGYRPLDGVKLGRQVLDLRPSGVGGDPNTLSLLSNEGWTWVPDLGLRLKEARPGLGRLDETLPAKGAFDAFVYTYGLGDEVEGITREATADGVVFDPDVEGRIAARDGSPFHYDVEGRRQDDDRFTYKWSWRGELVSVTVKPTRPDGSASPFAGQQIRYDYDAVGRLLSRTHVGELPSGETDDSKRPFIEKRRYLWDGSTLLSETAYAQDRSDGSEGPLRWRKSYVPGASGLDDAVQVRVETYDGAGASVLSEKLYSYLRDEQGTVTGIVEEKQGADPAHPPVLVRYLYDPYGQAHAELGEELYRATYDKTLTSVTPSSGPTATQTPTATAVSGALTLLFSEPINLATLSGLAVERRLTDGTWGALTAADLAIGRDPGLSESLVILPLSGWERTVAYRIRLTSALLATDGRGLAGTMTLQIEVPPTGDLLYDVPFPILYDSVFASGNDLKGAFPGGANALFQGLWTDPVTGIAFARARWYDARNAAFLQEDPAEDLDSASLYAFVGLRPNEATDPMGQFSIGFSLESGLTIDLEKERQYAKGLVSKTAQAFGVDKKTADTIGEFTVSTAETLAKVALISGGMGVLSAACPPCALGMGIYGVAAGAKAGYDNFEKRREEGETWDQALLGAAADTTGVSNAWAAATNKDIITGHDLNLTDEERARMAGQVVGVLAGGANARKAFERGARVGAKVRESVSAGFRTAKDTVGAFRKTENAMAGCRCFAAGTLVATEQGEKRIEAIEPGDKVVAYDPTTGITAFDEVQAGFLRLADRSVVVTVAGEQIFTTEEHPFFVVGKDWVPAAELKAGDRLLTITGKWLAVERIDVRETPTAVFNLLVAEAHTYYAGKSQVLVHNACPLTSRRPSAFESKARRETTIYEVRENGQPIYIGKTYQKGGGAIGAEARLAQHELTRPSWAGRRLETHPIASGNWTDYEAATHEMRAISERGGLRRFNPTSPLENMNRPITPKKFKQYQHLHSAYDPNPF